jgi:hypothetical protein
MSAYIRETPRRNMTALASLRRRIQQLTPYFSLLLLAVPLFLVEPVKFVAVFVAAKGALAGGHRNDHMRLCG